MLQQLTDYISGAWWSYLLIFALAYADVLIPIVPSETSVITAGVLAGSGEMNLAAILVCAASGAFLGDNTAYLIGRRWGDEAVHKVVRGEKGKKGLAWAKRELDERGGELILVARFIPLGRTLVTLTAGSLEMRWRRFAPFDAAAGIIWALYAGLLGYFGGKAFKDQPWKGLLIAFAVAMAIAGGNELWRWYRKRGREPEPEPE